MEKRLLIKSVDDFISQRKDYYNQWVFDQPILISKTHHEKLKRLHGIMHKFILHYVNNFNAYQNLMIISEKTKTIVEALKDIEYKTGTFRTDFVYDENKQPKLIEITCRFALNGLFENAIFDAISKTYQKEKIKDVDIINPFDELLPYVSKLSKTGTIFALKGSDKNNSSSIFKDIFKRTGVNVFEVNVNEISLYIDKMDSESWIISELTLDEIESLDLVLIKKLSALNISNDFRTALLIHDKQFFSILENTDIQEACLTSSEIDFFKDFLIPTYNKTQKPHYWEKAKQNKDHWILKHKALGKSKSIYAGLVTKQDVWDKIFETENLSDFILQKWIPQKKITAKIKGKMYEDYITGTLLFFNDHYFGLGFFRTSSFPVSNVVDDRKMSSLILSEDCKEIKTLFTEHINS